MLTFHRLGHIRLERAIEPPQYSAEGKVRAVIPAPAAPGVDRT